jgi:pilus assembly protein CpaB
MKPIHYAVFFVILFMATCLACAGGFFLGNRLGPHRAERVRDGSTTPILVAAQDLPVGTKLDQPEIQLHSVPFPIESLPPTAFANFEDLRGKVLGRSLSKNTPVTMDDLSFAEDLFKAAPPGKRAVTIKTSQEGLGGGFVLPGSRIDLIGTEPDPDDPKKSITKVFLKNIQVLAVNTAKEAPTNSNPVVLIPTSLTLAVTIEEAEKLAAARQRGPISVALRRPGD